MERRSVLTVAVLAGACGWAWADVPEYTTFRVEAMAGAVDVAIGEGESISSVTPVINNAGRVAFRTLGTASNYVVYTGGNGDAVSPVYTSGDVLLSDVSISGDGDVVWPITAGGVDSGVWRYDFGAGAALLTTLPSGATGWSGPQINDTGKVAYRAEGGGSPRYVVYDSAANSVTTYFTTGEDGVTFLATPQFNNANQIAAKVFLGSAQQIRLWNGPGNGAVVAQTTALDPTSPFTAFENGVGVNDLGQVAFIATKAAGGRGVFLYTGTQFIEIANTSSADIFALDSFAPVVNDAGVVAFRARDFNDSVLYAGDGTTLRKVVTFGQSIAVVNGEQMFFGAISSSGTDLGGGIDINDDGDIVWNGFLNNGATIRGQAVVVAEASGGETSCGSPDFNEDGGVDIFDVQAFFEAFGGTGPGDADFNRDGGVDIFDVDAFFRVFGGGEC